MPGEGGAFDADGEFADAAEDAEFAEGGFFDGLVEFGGDHVVEVVEEGAGFFDGLAF